MGPHGWSTGPSGMRNFIPVRYGTVFLQNTGIPVFFGTVYTLYFHTGIFWKLFGISLLVQNSDQFRNFSQLLEQAAQETFLRHHNKIKKYYQRK